MSLSFFSPRRRLVAASLAAAALRPFSVLSADAWPNRPVRFIVPFPPGGPVDTTARIFCHALDAELLAIAGLYLTSENLAADVPRHYVQAFLDGESLRVEALK